MPQETRTAPFRSSAPSGRPLTEADPLELWEAVASPQGISGVELRDRTLAADDFLMRFFSDPANLVVPRGDDEPVLDDVGLESVARWKLNVFADRRRNARPWGRRWRARWVPGRRLLDREARWP